MQEPDTESWINVMVRAAGRFDDKHRLTLTRSVPGVSTSSLVLILLIKEGIAVFL